MAALARWCISRRLTVILLWLAALVGLTVAASVAGSAYSSNYHVPGTESDRATVLLQQAFPGQSGDSDTIVWHTGSGTVRDPAVKARMTAALNEVAHAPRVASVTSPYAVTDAAAGQGQISRDGHTAYATVTFDAPSNDLKAAQVQRVVDAAKSGAGPDVQVALGGDGIALTQKSSGHLSEFIGVCVAAVVLLVAFGSFAAMGLKVVGIRRQADGPDLAQFEALAALHQPRLYIINSVLHNPISTSLSAAKAFQILRIAERHDIMVVEDDIYCDLHPGGVQSATRLAALDQLQRVIYLSGFSKSLAANLRVGFIAASRETVQRLADRKMLATLSTSDLGERIVYKILSEGVYRKHLDRIRARLDAVRPQVLRRIEALGMTLEPAPTAGMFAWADCGRDTNVLAARAMDEGLLLAPGSLFSPTQLPSTKLRLNVAALEDAGAWRFLERALG